MDAKRIKELRLRLGLTIDQFGVLLKVSPFTVRRWESGKHSPIPSLQDKLRELETKREDSGEKAP